MSCLQRLQFLCVFYLFSSSSWIIFFPTSDKRKTKNKRFLSQICFVSLNCYNSIQIDFCCKCTVFPVIRWPGNCCFVTVFSDKCVPTSITLFFKWRGSIESWGLGLHPGSAIYLLIVTLYYLKLFNWKALLRIFFRTLVCLLTECFNFILKNKYD